MAADITPDDYNTTLLVQKVSENKLFQMTRTHNPAHNSGSLTEDTGIYIYPPESHEQ